MVVVTHDIEDAHVLGHRVVHLRAGRMDTAVDAAPLA
jgi:ABC-type nitrate/sulfonate/bicarbonate transport system ATPase subunit